MLLFLISLNMDFSDLHFWYVIGVNISERKSGTEKTKKRNERELVFFHREGAHMVLHGFCPCPRETGYLYPRA